MPPKGVSGNPNGRPKGTPNKATADARAAIALFVESNVGRLYGWLDAIAAGVPNGTDDDGNQKWLQKPDPKAAYDCFMSVVEYHIPKLARSEVKAEVAQHTTVSLAENDKAIIERYLKK